MLKPKPIDEQRKVLSQHPGLLDEELAASVKAIREGLTDIDAGRTRPFHDVLAELEDG